MNRITTTCLTLIAGVVVACSSGPTVVEPTLTIPDDVGTVSGQTILAFEQGVEALDALPPDYATARTKFEQVVADTDELWEAWMNLGVLYTDLALYSDAENAFNQVLTAQPDSLEARIGLGRAYALWGQREDALEQYRDVIRASEEDEERTDDEEALLVEAQVNIAAVFVETADFGQARFKISEILVLDQNNPDALNLLGRIYHAEGDEQMAVYLWEKVLGLDENNADALNNMGLMQVQKGELGRAVRQFSRVIDLDPANVAAHLNLGAIYLDHLNFESSLSEFEQSLTLRPRNETALMGRAASLYGMGDSQAAYDAYSEVSQNYTDNCQAMWRLGELAFRDLDDVASATDWYDRNLRCRGLNATTCDPSNDEVCARINAIQQMERQTTPREPEPGELEGDEESD